ncbi:lysis protein [Enterococcus ureilyticus]|uniref:Lysis protein n=1 Tax=Enterococcus ureilyticus TaxID=1131292 RepID=A0A1E5HE41_9ENTE|nr:PepSY domain-containing protein [Enterococcus ureilyticus]MBM7689774.1 putative membrane protein YkoI [Enterococcus ureilyticus]MBO0446035.1 PepSY domain-containing protein [Enterococcus ureilyticus]OEG23209.1 lysis protein [Enterococcus ureilyticus]
MNKKMMIGTVCLGLLLAGCTSNNKSLENQAQTSNSSIKQTTPTDSGTIASDSTKTSQIKVTVDEAIKAYEAAYPNTAVTSLDLDPSFGIYYYEIKGVDDSKEYEVKIHAETGELTKDREETLDQDEQNGVEKKNEALDLTKLKSLDEASKIAQDTVGEGTAIEWSLERDLSITYWEVKVQAGKKEVSVKINAQTGDVLEQELDD